jgi:hypothetical protein
MRTGHSTEKGQALILVVFGIVALLGFTALAIDGGMLYADRRHAQSAADAASLAGGGAAALYMDNHGVKFSNWNCGGSALTNAASTARTTAINRAASNDYTIDMDISDHHGVVTQCGVDTGAGYPDKYLDIHTQFTAQTETAFAHLLFAGSLMNTVEAITRVRPRQSLAFGYAIVALNPDACQGQQNGATFHGNALVSVTGGGIFSNGCLRGNGGPSVTVYGAPINYVVNQTGNAAFTPQPQQVPNRIPPDNYTIPAPDCNDPNAYNMSGNQLLGASPLAPGLYCISGDLRINGNDSLYGSGVTVVMLNGELRINGNAEVQLSAPGSSPDPTPAVPNIVIYAPPSNTNDLQINGNSTSFFTGTILAPGSNIDMLGTGFTDAFHTQVIGWNVEVGGTADTYVVFDDNEQYSKSPSLELSK